MSRRLRGKRAPGGSVELTERDLRLLALVGLSGYAGTDQLAREFFPTRDRALRRLRQLFDAKLIAITLANSTKPSLVSLTPNGLAQVLEEMPQLIGRARLAGAIRLAAVEHHTAILDVRLFAAAFGSASGTPLLRWSNAGGELNRELGLTSWHLAPDGIGEFNVGGEASYVAVEVDCGTEAHAVITAKLDRYVSAFRAEVFDRLWLVIKGGASRRAGLAELVGSAGLQRVASVMNHEALLARPVTPAARDRHQSSTTGVR